MIVSKFGMGDEICPRGGVISTVDSQICFDFLVYSFHFSIGLWVISGGKGQGIFEEFSEFLGECGGELWAAI